MAVSQEIQEQMLKEATSVTPNFSVDMNGEQFQQVDKEMAQQGAALENAYNSVIGSTDKLYGDLKEALAQNKITQSQIQQDQTDFAIEKIEQEKDKAHKDYLKEQSGAYVDWQKQSNKYGVEAEKMASAGLSNTGYSESSQVSMYNTYQNRIATARESFENAKLNYNNAIKDAILQNSAALAQIAADTLQKQLQLSIEAAQYNNQLIIDLAGKKQELANVKWNRYQDILNQINTENQLKWDYTKYYDNKKFQEGENQKDRDFQLKRDEINNAFTEKLEGIKHDYDIKYLNAKTEKDKELAKEEYNYKVKLAQQEQKDALARIDRDYQKQKELYSYKAKVDNSYNSAPISGGSGSGVSKGAYAVAKSAKASSSGNSSSAPINKTSNAVSTAYYQGAKNKDASKYGTFSNGYQPKGISGHGKLSKTGKTVNVDTSIKYGDNKGQKVTVKQNVWKAEDGTKWIWDGVNNKYVRA